MSLNTVMSRILGVPTDPVVEQEKPVQSTFGWATVTAVGPLRIRKDGETDELPMTPEVIGSGGFPTGARVWCQFFGLRVMILGGPLPPAAGAWRLISYSSGWSNFGGSFELGGFILDNGWVNLQGVCKGGSGTMFVLPSGYTPAAAHQFLAAAAGGIANVLVYPSGFVTLSGFLNSGNSSSVSLSQIRFKPTPL